MGFDINHAETSNIATGEIFICMIKSEVFTPTKCNMAFSGIRNIISKPDASVTVQLLTENLFYFCDTL
jgi:hypothetical protein